ncbi:unnamed protein product [Discosporangium mesarthrocarpum]
MLSTFSPGRMSTEGHGTRGGIILIKPDEVLTLGVLALAALWPGTWSGIAAVIVAQLELLTATGEADDHFRECAKSLVTMLLQGPADASVAAQSWSHFSELQQRLPDELSRPLGLACAVLQGRAMEEAALRARRKRRRLIGEISLSPMVPPLSPVLTIASVAVDILGAEQEPPPEDSSPSSCPPQGEAVLAEDGSVYSGVGPSSVSPVGNEESEAAQHPLSGVFPGESSGTPSSVPSSVPGDDPPCSAPHGESPQGGSSAGHPFPEAGPSSVAPHPAAVSTPGVLMSQPGLPHQVVHPLRGGRVPPVSFNSGVLPHPHGILSYGEMGGMPPRAPSGLGAGGSPPGGLSQAMSRAVLSGMMAPGSLANVNFPAAPGVSGVSSGMQGIVTMPPPVFGEGSKMHASTFPLSS